LNDGYSIRQIEIIVNPTKEVEMSHLRVSICRVEDEPGKVTELHSFDLPAVDPDKMKPENALDQMESQVLTHGQKIMRYLLEQQWVDTDELLTEKHEEAFPPWNGDP
jgi:hypothetical protein